MSKDEVLKLALEALVSSTGELHRHLASPNDYQLVKNHRAIAAIKAALEAKDEPDQYAMDIECTKCGAKQSGVITVHTTPLQRTWVGLTDQVKQEWIDAMPSPPQSRHFMVLVNAIESELKELNT
jgi:hypothetical protein